MLSFVSCGDGGKDMFKSLIPNEIYNYTIYDNSYNRETDQSNAMTFTSNLSDIEIIREATNNDLYDGTAKLTLDDENINRTVELTIHARKYDTGGWHLESYTVDNFHVNEFKENGVRECADIQLSKIGFDSINFKSFASDTNTCTFDVSYSSKYIDITGSIDLTINGIDQKGFNSFYYADNCIYNTDKMNIDCKAFGIYKADLDGEINIEISKGKSKGNLAWSGTRVCTTKDYFSGRVSSKTVKDKGEIDFYRKALYYTNDDGLSQSNNSIFYISNIRAHWSGLACSGFGDIGFEISPNSFKINGVVNNNTSQISRKEVELEKVGELDREPIVPW